MQHDRDFRPPLPGDGPTFFPNEDFFLHRLIPEEDTAGGGAVRALYQEALDDPQAGGRPPLLGKRLRLEEEQEPFASRKSEPGDGSWFWYRDYYHLCRGKELVEIQNLIIINYCNPSTVIIVMKSSVSSRAHTQKKPT